MFIRPATQSDADTLAPLFRAFFDEDGIDTPTDAIAANLRKILADNRACIFVIAVDGRIAGFASGILTFGVEFGCAAELEDLYVCPQYRGRGWARPLLAAVLQWAEAQGASETILIITPEAEADQFLTRFYSKFGFKDSRRIMMYRSNFLSGG
ncbi:MAG: GNAT family N-acetyltransferase [Rhodobacteraceae bacterium]|nr:GNAT family N-acetyltransferase [Paracoccaceae bacterium]